MHMVLERTFVTAVCNFGVVSLGIFLQRRSHRARKAFRRRGRPGSGGNSVYPASTVAVTVDTRIIKRLRDRWLFISDCWLLSYRLIFILFFSSDTRCGVGRLQSPSYRPRLLSEPRPPGMPYAISLHTLLPLPALSGFS